MYVCTYTCVHTYVRIYAIHMCTFVHTYVLQCICICEVVLYVRNCMNVQYVLSYMHCVGKYFPSEMGYSVEFSPLGSVFITQCSSHVHVFVYGIHTNSTAS